MSPGPNSIPLSPPGRVARRGQLALVGTRYDYGSTGRGIHWTLAEIVSVTRTGEVKAWRDPLHPGDHPHKTSWTNAILAVVDASGLDRDRCLLIARNHTWPGGGPRPWESFDEAKDALRPAFPAGKEGAE